MTLSGGDRKSCQKRRSRNVFRYACRCRCCCAQHLARCVSKAAAQPAPQGASPGFLVPFCCAAAATARACVRVLAAGGGAAQAQAFMAHAFDKASKGAP